MFFFFTKFLVGGLAFGDDFSVLVEDVVRWGGFKSGTESDEGGLGKIVHWGQNAPLQQNYNEEQILGLLNIK